MNNLKTTLEKKSRPRWFHLESSINYLVTCTNPTQSLQENRKERTISQFNILLVEVGFKLRASHLLSRHTVTRAMPPALFVLLILVTRSHFLSRLALALFFLFYSAVSWLVHHCAQLLADIGSPKVLLGLAWNPILLISGSQVAKITGTRLVQFLKVLPWY
jgi:hypothetical protein